MATNTVRVELVGVDKSMSRTISAASKNATTLGSRMKAIGSQMQSLGRSLTVGVTLPVVAGFALATKAAVDEEKEMALLAKAIKNNTDATAAQIAATEEWVTAQQNATGIADGELRPALAALVAVTKDTAKAQDLLTVAMDIAVAKGKDVTTIAEALAKAQNGNIGILSRYGIATRDAAGEMMSFEEVMQNAADTFGGAAATAAETSAGKFAIMKAQLQDLAEAIGSALIPVLTDIVDTVMPVIEAFGRMSDGQRKVIVVVGLVVAALGPLLTILGTIISIAPAVGAAFTFMTGPVGIVIVAIAALVAILIVLYKKNETFRNVVNAVWGAVKSVVASAVPVFKTIWTVAVAAFNGIVKAIRAVVDAVQWLWGKLSWLRGVIASLHIPNPFSALISAIRTVINLAQDAWGWISKLASSNPRSKDTAGKYPGHRASGGIVTRPELSWIGEAGPEAIIPLTKPARAAQVMAEAGLVGGGTINVNVVVPGGTTLIGTAREVGEVIAPHVARALGRTAARAGRRR